MGTADVAAKCWGEQSSLSAPPPPGATRLDFDTDMRCGRQHAAATHRNIKTSPHWWQPPIPATCILVLTTSNGVTMSDVAIAPTHDDSICSAGVSGTSASRRRLDMPLCSDDAAAAGCGVPPAGAAIQSGGGRDCGSCGGSVLGTRPPRIQPMPPRVRGGATSVRTCPRHCKPQGGR